MDEKSERRGWWQAASVRCRRFLGRLRAGRESRRYRYKGSSQQRHFCFALVLGSLGSLPMMNGGGGFFSFRKGILCVQRTERNDRNRDSRCTALRNTNDCRLRGKCGSRLGAHTSLGRTRKGGSVSVAIRGVLKTCTDVRGSLAMSSVSVWGVSVGRTEIPDVQSPFVWSTAPLN